MPRRRRSGSGCALQDISDGTMGKYVWTGIIFGQHGCDYHPDKQTVETSMPLRLAAAAFKPHFMQPDGVIYGSSMQRTPFVRGASWGLLLVWDRQDRGRYQTRLISPVEQTTFRGDHMSKSFVLVYSFTH